jgi:hypothetical protein
MLGPGDLRLPGGRTPHDFLGTEASGNRAEVERFETVRPDATIEVPANMLGDRSGEQFAGERDGRSHGLADTFDVLVELDDRLPEG